ncbi:MAG TPA: two-component sensor histidine kinase, partial [Pseudomonas sp.]|nr:two-component sensor histidine kinase [Pseudomonas sp.]
MNRRLFWKLCLGVALGSVALFWVIARLSGQAEEQMSFIDAEHQRT